MALQPFVTGKVFNPMDSNSVRDPYTFQHQRIDIPDGATEFFYFGFKRPDDHNSIWGWAVWLSPKSIETQANELDKWLKKQFPKGDYHRRTMQGQDFIFLADDSQMTIFAMSWQFK